MERIALDINLSMLFTELPLHERPGAAREHGFDAVEFWWPFADPTPTHDEVERFVASLDDAQVRLVALNLYAGDMSAGQRGIVSWPTHTSDFRASVDPLLEIARRTGCRRFNALYGQRLPGTAPEEQDRVAQENLAFAAEAVAPLDGVILIEPLAHPDNGAYPLRSAADALHVIECANDAGHLNLALLADTYHLTANGEDPNVVVERHAERIGHVQIADCPGRHQPGTGDIDFAGFFATLEQLGYAGHVGLEYRPSGSSAESLTWLTAMEEAH